MPNKIASNYAIITPKYYIDFIMDVKNNNFANNYLN